MPGHGFIPPDHRQARQGRLQIRFDDLRRCCRNQDIRALFRELLGDRLGHLINIAGSHHQNEIPGPRRCKKLLGQAL